MKYRNIAKKFGSVTALTIASIGAAHAQIDDTAVTAAFTSGGVSVSNAVTGLILLVAGVVGITMVIMLLRKA